MTDMTPDDHN